MSVPSSKVTTTCDRPNLETERSCSRRGRPLRTCSTGKVICFSISSGPRAGATVLICTCTGVVSGKASMLRRRSDNAPTTTKTTVPRITRKRCRREMSMIQLSTGFPPCREPVPRSLTARTGLLVSAPSARAQAVLQQFRPQGRAVGGRDHFPREHAGDDLGVLPVRHPRQYRPDVEHFQRAVKNVLVLHEHDVAVTFPVQGLVRHDHRLLFF